MNDRKNQLGVYSVVLDESGREHWVEIGYATRHHDGEGFDLTVQALRVASRLVLRETTSDDSQLESQGVESHGDSHEEPKGEFQDTGTFSLASQVRDFERAVIRQCLLETGGNIAAVLERLKIPRRTLNEKMVRLGIDRRGFKASRRPKNGPRTGLAAKVDDANPEPESTVVHGEPRLFLEHPQWSKNGASNGQ
jgi:hypothetical protein